MLYNIKVVIIFFEMLEFVFCFYLVIIVVFIFFILLVKRLVVC